MTVLASFLTILTALFVQPAFWDDSDCYLLLGVLISDADIDVSSSEVIAAESLVHFHLYDSQAIFLYMCVGCFDIFLLFSHELFCISQIVSSSDISMSRGRLKTISFQSG